MAKIDLSSGASGTTVVLSGNDQIFHVSDGSVQFSTDGGTTWIPFFSGDKVVFADGLSVDSKNVTQSSASFSHMDI